MRAGAPLYQIDAEDYSVRLVRYAPHQRMARHAHDEDGISLVIAGELVEEAEHRTILASPGWAVIKPRGTYHETRFGERGGTLLAVIPRRSLASAVPRRWQWVQSASGLQPALRFIKGTNEGDTEGAAEAMSELVAALTSDEESRIPSLWLRRVQQSLDRFEAPSVARLAADAGVHPVYLTRAFRASFGISIREYRQVVQVRRAVQLVVSTKLPLAQIALECGFSDHSHMCRSFRIVAGWSPGVLRRY